MRLRAYGDVLTATVAPIYGNSLMGTDPNILGMRIARLLEPSSLDAVVSIAAVLDRLASKSQTLEIPPTREVVSWAGISPPQQGWQVLGSVSASQIKQVAEQGITEVAQAVPGSLGASLVQRVRSDVWSRHFSDFDLPAGVCFALSGLGFLVSGEDVTVFQSGNWRRLSTPYGHVLTKAI